MGKEGVPRAGKAILTQVSTDLAKLLRARSFCPGALTAPLLARLTANLQAVGGTLDPAALAFIGEGTPPADRPSIGAGDEAGTLGPRSFGFLNNVDGTAPLLAPLSERPRLGGVALVVPRRDALPEVVPLLCRRRLGISWLISVGDGDPADVIRFLSVDPATTGILVALGRGARAATLHEVLGSKQAALLELQTGAGPGREGTLCRAVARRAGVAAVSGLEEWLAHGALFDAAAKSGASAGSKRTRAQVVVIGAGGDFVAAEAQRARLGTPLRVESDDPGGLAATLAQAALDADLVILCGDPETTAEVTAPRPTLRVDPSQPERLSALFRAVAERPLVPADRKPMPVKADADKVASLMADLPPPLYVGGSMVVDEALSDHDAKRLLRSFGARVSRQAPANTITAVVRVAAQIGLPVVLVVPESALRAAIDSAGKEELLADEEHVCPTQPDLKRQATLLLSRVPHILVREKFPDQPRVRLTVTQERSLGGLMRLGGEAAMLPVQRCEARELAEPLATQHDFDDRKLVELIGQISACASEHPVTLDLELHLGDQPAVVRASGVLKRQKGK